VKRCGDGAGVSVVTIGVRASEAVTRLIRSARVEHEGGPGRRRRLLSGGRNDRGPMGPGEARPGQRRGGRRRMGWTVAHNVRSPAEADSVTEGARSAGAKLMREPGKDVLGRLLSGRCGPRRPPVGDRPQSTLAASRRRIGRAGRLTVSAPQASCPSVDRRRLHYGDLPVGGPLAILPPAGIDLDPARVVALALLPSSSRATTSPVAPSKTTVARGLARRL
jgi:hypothetical protein